MLTHLPHPPALLLLPPQVYPCRLSVIVLPAQQILEAATLVDCARRLCAVYGAPWHIRFKLQVCWPAKWRHAFVGSPCTRSEAVGDHALRPLIAM